MADLWTMYILTALATLCMLLTLRIATLSRSLRSMHGLAQQLEEAYALATKARAAAITAQARVEALTNNAQILGETNSSVQEVHQALNHTIEQASTIKTELAVFVEHGDKVVARLNDLISGMGKR